MKRLMLLVVVAAAVVVVTALSTSPVLAQEAGALIGLAAPGLAARLAY